MTSFVKNTFMSRLNEIRGAETNRSLARKLDITEGTIRNWDKKKSALPRADIAAQIADMYGVHLLWLVTGKGQKFVSVDTTADAPQGSIVSVDNHPPIGSELGQIESQMNDLGIPLSNFTTALWSVLDPLREYDVIFIPSTIKKKHLAASIAKALIEEKRQS